MISTLWPMKLPCCLLDNCIDSNNMRSRSKSFISLHSNFGQFSVQLKVRSEILSHLPLLIYLALAGYPASLDSNNMRSRSKSFISLHSNFGQFSVQLKVRSEILSHLPLLIYLALAGYPASLGFPPSGPLLSIPPSRL